MIQPRVFQVKNGPMVVEYVRVEGGSGTDVNRLSEVHSISVGILGLGVGIRGRH